MPPYLKPSQLWIAVPRQEYCDRNDKIQQHTPRKAICKPSCFCWYISRRSAMNRPRITCSSLQGWTTALLHIPFPKDIHRDTQALPQPPASESVCSPCSQPAQSCPTAPIPYRHSKKPRSRMQWRLGKPKSKPSVPSGALMCPRLCYRGDISIPCWTSTTSAAAPCNEHIFSMTNPTQSGQKNWNPFLPLKRKALLIKLGKTHQNPKSKGMLCSFWQIITISFIYKNETAPKPQLHTQKKLLVVSKDYRNEFNCLTEQHIVFIPHFAGLGNHCSLTIGWQSKKCLTLFF